MKDLTYTHEKYILVHPRLDIGSINLFDKNSHRTVRTVITVQNSVILSLLTHNVTTMTMPQYIDYCQNT